MFNMYFQLSLLLGLHALLVEADQCSITGSGASYIWTSPRYPTKNYPKNQNCSFPADFSGPKIINYTLTDFILQDKTRGKCQDDVVFTKPFHKQIKICGTMNETTISIPMGGSSATFSSNHKIGRKGFAIQVDYWTNDYTKEYTMSSSGTSNLIITNPSYPDVQSGHMAEYWVKTDDPDKKIKLFFEVDVKKKMCCNQDYLVINRAGDPIYPRVTSRLFCGIRRSYMSSKGKKMYVSYRSDDPGKFKLNFTLVDSS